MANAVKPGSGASNKRRRELAAAELERQSARRAARESTRRRRRRAAWGGLAILGIVVVLGVVFWPQSDSETTASPTPAPSPTGNVDIGCDPAPTFDGEVPSWKKEPALALEEGTDYTLNLATNCGDIVIATAAEDAEHTVNSMLWLAQEGFYNSTLCHRVTTGGLYVLQCGDPTGSGGGNAGYTLADENLPEAGDNNYSRGTVAMANSGPDTGSSQFFIVYQDTTLPANYTIWGEVTEGLDVVQKVADAGVVGGGTDGEPAGSIGIVTATPEPKLD